MTLSLAVVISTYNKPDYLRLVLEGYRQQTSLKFSIYIADDGSSMETKALIDTYQADFPVPVRHFWHDDQDFRKSRIHNTTFQHIPEPYILLTDGDCIPHPKLVQQHLHHATHNHFINGSRILLQEDYTNALCLEKKSLPIPPNFFYWLQQRLGKNINRILPLLLPSCIRKLKGTKLSGIHGCHLSCWKDDLMTVDGFDEAFEGWGREDSDLIARFFHAGIQRADLLGTPVFHLWHQEESRTQLNKNDQYLQQCLKDKRIRANKGISSHG